MRTTLAALSLLLASVSLAVANAPRAPAETRTNPFDGQVIACNDPGVLGRIQSRFNSRESRDWNSPLQVTQIDQASEIAFRPNGQDLIPRRYCKARALLSDGKFRALRYNMSEDGGISGWQGSLFLGLVRFPTPSSYHLEWCITGLDRHRTYAPECRTAGP
ncbi:MAG: hypothetical protein ACKVON_10060 [Beijerinckiaceae bacterium]